MHLTQPAVPDNAAAIAEIYSHGMEDHSASSETDRRMAEDISQWFAQDYRRVCLG